MLKDRRLRRALPAFRAIAYPPLSNQLLGLPYIQIARHHDLERGDLFRLERKPQQGPRMTLGDRPGAEGFLDLLRRVENPERVRDRDSAPADSLGNLRLGDPKLCDQLPVGSRFFEDREIGPLNILDQGELEQPTGTGLPHDCRDRPESGHPGGAPATLTDNELKRGAVRTTGDNQGLDQAMLTNRRRQRFELCRSKRIPRLIWIRADRVDLNVLDPVPVRCTRRDE